MQIWKADNCEWIVVSAWCLTCAIPPFPNKEDFDVRQMAYLTQKASPNTCGTQENNSSEPSVHL